MKEVNNLKYLGCSVQCMEGKIIFAGMGSGSIIRVYYKLNDSEYRGKKALQDRKIVLTLVYMQVRLDIK